MIFTQIRSAGAECADRMGDHRRWRGETVSVNFPPGLLHLFDPVSGVRLN